jgi:sugar lactone lactonase YvrE
MPLLLVASPAASAASGGASTAPATLHVIAKGLNAPHGLTVEKNGDIYVAAVGNGKVGAACKKGTEAACVNNSGAVLRITPKGAVSSVVTKLPMIGNPGDAIGAAGVADVWVVGKYIYAVIQNSNINSKTGDETYGKHGALLGDLVRAPLSGGPAKAIAALGPYEAAHNPDHGAGHGPGDPPIDSDPYGVVAFNGGLAVADAAGNDVLFISSAGKISVLAVLPLIAEPTGKGHHVMSQPVPTSLAVGPNGSLYVGELGGAAANDVGDVNVYRIAAHGKLDRVASGLTMIGGIAFSHSGKLLVLEIDTAGINDPSPGLPAPGALIQINSNGSKTTLASKGLEFPLGLAVGPTGSIYMTNYGILPGSGGPIPGLSGEVVRLG